MGRTSPAGTSLIRHIGVNMTGSRPAAGYSHAPVSVRNHRAVRLAALDGVGGLERCTRDKAGTEFLLMGRMAGRRLPGAGGRRGRSAGPEQTGPGQRPRSPPAWTAWRLTRLRSSASRASIEWAERRPDTGGCSGRMGNRSSTKPAAWPARGSKENREYGKLIRQQYGSDHRRYTEDGIRTLTALGFNAFGMWSFLFNQYRGHEQYGWPFVEYFHAREIRPQACVNPKIIDPFDPAWQAAHEAACKKRCPELRDNPNLLGYYTENEPFWGQAPGSHVWGQTPLKAPLLLQTFLALPADRAGHRAAWEFVLKRHEGSEAKRGAGLGWNLPDAGLSSASRPPRARSSVRKPTAATTRRSRCSSKQTFFRVTGEALRRHDPNHLILGVRHAALSRRAWHGHLARLRQALRGCALAQLLQYALLRKY